MRWHVIACMMLAGCSTIGPIDTSPRAEKVCPEPITYTPKFIKQAASELRRCKCPAVKQMLLDYRAERAQLREAKR